jgi:Flp pilus assembly protein TadG
MPEMKTRAGSERGAVLIQVAIALAGLIALSAFVVDYGVLWVARRQAQNSADAAAMAGAISMGYVDMDNQGLARDTAINVGLANLVWGAPPEITAADVTFPACPVGSPGAGSNACIRADVYRNQQRGNALPTFFGGIVGIANQGVRASATAQVMFGDSTDCVKPFAIADKWLELRNDQGPAGWSEEDSFERYVQNGRNAGQLLTPTADYYEAPGAPGGIYGPNGTGFTRESTALGGDDHGRAIILKSGQPNQAIAPGWYHPVVINPTEGPGGANYRDNIATCDPTIIGPGSVLQVEPGNMVGPTNQGIRDLIALDPGASWNTTLNNGEGGIQGGCMAAGTCGISPRLVAIPVFNPDIYDAGRASGRVDITIVKVLGFFIQGMVNGNDVLGYLTTYPSTPRSGTTNTPGASFVVSIALVR